MPIMVRCPFLSVFVLAWRLCCVFLFSTHLVISKGRKCCVVEVVFTPNCDVPVVCQESCGAKDYRVSGPNLVVNQSEIVF